MIPADAACSGPAQPQSVIFIHADSSWSFCSTHGFALTPMCVASTTSPQPVQSTLRRQLPLGLRTSRAQVVGGGDGEA